MWPPRMLEEQLRSRLLISLAILLVGCTGAADTALAQSPPSEAPSAQQGAACPPDVKGEPPTVGGGSSSAPLSDKLAQSKGVICPPSSVDRDMQVTPPAGGRLKVIPPPGSPGGDQSVQPK